MLNATANLFNSAALSLSTRMKSGDKNIAPIDIAAPGWVATVERLPQKGVPSESGRWNRVKNAIRRKCLNDYCHKPFCASRLQKTTHDQSGLLVLTQSGPMGRSERREGTDSVLETGGFRRSNSLGIARRVLLVSALTLVASAPARADEPAPAKTVRVAGIVLKWLRTDKEANYRRAEPLIREAAAGGARIVCTTECFLDGYAIADKSIPLETYRALGEPIPDGPYCRRLRDLAKELHIYLIAGMTEADGDARYNTAVLIGPDGNVVGKYHKQRLDHEAVRNTAGRESSVFPTEFGKVGVMICADRRTPEIVKGFCTSGADFLICPSGGMFGPKSNDPILQARSKENGKHIVFVHPAEFLVTAPDGSITQQTVLGDKLLIPPEEIDRESDSHRVFYFDLPLPRATHP